MKIDKREFTEMVKRGLNTSELAKFFNVKPNRIYTIGRELGLNVKIDPNVKEQRKINYWIDRLKMIYEGTDLCGRITIPNDIMQKLLQKIEKAKGKL